MARRSLPTTRWRRLGSRRRDEAPYNCLSCVYSCSDRYCVESGILTRVAKAKRGKRDKVIVIVNQIHVSQSP